MRTDDALAAIVELRALWRQRRGRVTLAELGIIAREVVRTRGHAGQAPERWRRFPGREATRHERRIDL